MKTRIVLGTLLVSLLAGLFLLDRLNESRTILSVLIIVLGLAAWCEIAVLGGVGDRARGGGLPLFATGLGATAYLLVVAWLEGANRIHDSVTADAGLAVSLLLLFACVVFRTDHTAGFQPLLVAILGLMLIGFLLSYTLRIYHLPDGPLIGAILVGGIKGNDIAAYFIGRFFGKRRVLWVSPKKTLEGCAAGIIFSAFWFAGAALAWPEAFFPWPWCFLLGIIIAIAAQMGDLSKSLIKRFYQVKDSARLLPEFGGVLDLIDSALFSGFLYWVPFSIAAAGAGSSPG